MRKWKKTAEDLTDVKKMEQSTKMLLNPYRTP